MRDKIIELLYAENVRSDCGIERLADEICTIDPVKHGRWITKSTNGEFFDCCSSCGYVEWDEPKNYCPNCGAMMRGEEDEVDSRSREH